MKPIQSILNNTDSSYRQQLNETKTLVNKWGKTGLLEGIDADYARHGMAIMLENQAKQLVQEANNSTGTGANSEQWAGVALPLVRRIFAEIAAKDFVSVQPMNLPSGLVFYLDFKYGTGVAGFNNSGTSNDPTKPGYQRDSVFGITNDTTDPSQGLYGAGRFGYSINDQTTVVGITGSLNATTVTQASGAIAISTFASAGTLEQVNYDTKFSASFAATSASIKVITVSTASFTTPDLKGVRAFVPSGSGIFAVFPQFTSYNATNETFSFVVSGSISTTAAATNVTFTYQVQPTAQTRGDFEDTSNSLNNLNIPEIQVELRSDTITAKTRKLKSIWTPEFAQDLNAYHSIDAEAELTSMLSEHVSMEVDLEILDMLIQNATTTEYWSTQVGEYWNGNGFTSDSATNAASAYNQGQWFQTLGTKIQKVSNKIHQKTMRGGANFLVCSPDIATILESIPGYAADTNGDKMQFAMGVQKVGLLSNRFTVYKNPYMLENTILLGYRGAQFLETGAVYAPYVPLIMTPLVYDPNNFTPRKGVMTRYAKKVVRPEFYGRIYVKGLQSI